MAFSQDDVYISHQLSIGEGFPRKVLKTGEEKVRGSVAIEGPVVIGSLDSWSQQTATVMIGPDENIDSDGPQLDDAIISCGSHNNSPYSLHVVGDGRIDDNLDVKRDVNAGGIVRAGTNIESQGDVTALCGAHRLSLKKNFDIPHPTKPGWRLRHTCTEAPYNDVYIRGRLKHQNEIILPDYWEDFVDVNSITVNVTPIGVSQHIMVSGITKKKIRLSSNSVLPIDCFYHVFATRADGDVLIPEYEGNTPDDYPGNNSEYLINK